jgi:hypothetical protein
LLCCFCFETHITTPIKARPLSWLLWVSYTSFVCDTDTDFRSFSQWCLWLWETCCFI